MGAAVGLRHDGDDGDAGGGADGLGAEAGEEGGAVGLGDGGDHLHQLGGAGEAVLAARRGLERVQVDVLAAPRALRHGGDDLRDGADARLLLGEPRGEGDHAAAPGGRLLPRLRRRHRRRRGGEAGSGDGLASLSSFDSSRKESFWQTKSAPRLVCLLLCTLLASRTMPQIYKME